MPIIESVNRRIARRRPMLTKPSQVDRRWNGVFKLAKAFRRVKVRTEPADVYVSFDDRRIMQAVVDAYASAMLDRLTTQAAHDYIGDVLTTEDDKRQFANYIVGRKETLVGEAELIHLSQLLYASKIRSRYSADAIGAYIVKRFNKKRPLGMGVTASVEFKDVVLTTTR